MWIFTTGGFVSAVEDKNNAEGVVVRARDRAALVNMLEGIELAGNASGDAQAVGEIVTGEGTDYRWRVRLSKATFAIWLQYEVLNFLDYGNFKNALTAERGDDYHRACMNVWTDMLAVDDGPKQTGKKRNWNLTGRDGGGWGPEPTFSELRKMERELGFA